MIRRSRHASFFSFLAAVRTGFALAFWSFLRCFIWPAVRSPLDGATFLAFVGITAVRFCVRQTLLRVYIKITFKTTHTPHTGAVLRPVFFPAIQPVSLAYACCGAVPERRRTLWTLFGIGKQRRAWRRFGIHTAPYMPSFLEYTQHHTCRRFWNTHSTIHAVVLEYTQHHTCRRFGNINIAVPSVGDSE